MSEPNILKDLEEAMNLLHCFCEDHDDQFHTGRQCADKLHAVIDTLVKSQIAIAASLGKFGETVVHFTAALQAVIGMVMHVASAANLDRSKMDELEARLINIVNGLN